jgi:hypothetical protein
MSTKAKDPNRPYDSDSWRNVKIIKPIYRPKFSGCWFLVEFPDQVVAIVSERDMDGISEAEMQRAEALIIQESRSRGQVNDVEQLQADKSFSLDEIVAIVKPKPMKEVKTFLDRRLVKTDRKYKTLSGVFFKGSSEGQINSVFKTMVENPQKVIDYKAALENGDCLLPSELSKALQDKLRALGMDK